MATVQGSSATASTVAPDGSDRADPEPTQVRTLGKYELLRLIDRGGMGEVHLARLSGELGFEKRLVIKTIRSDLAADQRFVELFAAEAKIAVALSHPNIAPIYELGRADDGTLYTAMGWVDGPSLDAVGRRLRELERTLDLKAALFIARELLDGLAHAHSRDRDRPPVVHRDITPRNVLIDRSGRVQIVDFGIAKPAESKVAGKMGSAGYMAPEQARGEPVDPRADVFSVGCVLYELLTNERALTGEGVWMLPSFARVAEPVRPLLARALALEPGDRFADADAFLRSLAPLLATEAPSFGTRDLARIVADLFGDDWSPRPSAPANAEARTPATRMTAAVQTFATRSDPEPTPDVDDSAEPPREQAVVETRRSSALAWPLVAALAVLAGVIGIGLASTDDPPSRPEPVSQPAVDDPPREVDPPAADAPKPTPSIEPIAPFVASITIEVSPADASVTIDGEPLDGPPYLLPRPDDRAVELRVEHPDFRAQARSLDARSPTNEPIRVELEPLEDGTLTVLAPSVAWAEVWVDGGKLGTTPLTEKPVLEGKHKLEVRCTAAVCGTAQTLLARNIRVRPGRLLTLNADAD